MARLSFRNLLAGLCAVLLAAFAYAIAAPLPEVSVASLPERAKLNPLPMLRSVAAPSSTSFAAINDRPLFIASRKAIAPAALGNAAAPPPPPTVTLVGVIIDPSEKLALIRLPQSPLETAVSVGQSVAGWNVAEIESDRIVLRQGTTDDEIKMEANRAPQKSQTPEPTQPSTAVPQPPVKTQ